MVCTSPAARPSRTESRPPLRRDPSSVSVTGVLFLGNRCTCDNRWIQLLESIFSVLFAPYRNHAVNLRTDDEKTKRVKCLSPEQKEAVMAMTDPSEMPLEERRRQYNAINRRITNPNNAKTFPAGLIEKWEAASTPQAKLLVILYIWKITQVFYNMHCCLVQNHLLISNLETSFSDPSCCPGSNFSSASFSIHRFRPCTLKPGSKSRGPSVLGFAKGFILENKSYRDHPT